MFYFMRPCLCLVPHGLLGQTVSVWPVRAYLQLRDTFVNSIIVLMRFCIISHLLWPVDFLSSKSKRACRVAENDQGVAKIDRSRFVSASLLRCRGLPGHVVDWTQISKDHKGEQWLYLLPLRISGEKKKMMPVRVVHVFFFVFYF